MYKELLIITALLLIIYVILYIFFEELDLRDKESTDCNNRLGVYIVRSYNDRLCIDVSEALEVYER